MCKRLPSKKHFACFACRKSFKQPASAEWQTPEEIRPFPCPECRSPMNEMGSDFKAPRQRDARQWLKVEVLYRFGITYFPRCCYGPGPRPTELGDVEAFLTRQGHDRQDVRQRIKIVKELRSKQRPALKDRAKPRKAP